MRYISHKIENLELRRTETIQKEPKQYLEIVKWNNDKGDKYCYTIAIFEYKEKEDEWISEVALSYIDSIINLCQDNKIELILVGSPVHKDYYKRIPPDVIDRFDFEKNKLKNQGLLVIDLTNDFYPDDYYLNTDHLNKKGSSRFSAEILKILKNQKTTTFNKNP